MGTIESTADDVALYVVNELESLKEFEAQKPLFFDAAKLAALMMSDRLEKSIPASDFYARIIEFQARAFSQAQSHNQIYIGIGYATLTAVWSATASNISVFAMLLSGGCLLLSAGIFVGWTITGMFVSHTSLMNIQSVYAEGPVDFIERNAAAEQQNMLLIQKVQRWWKPVVAAAGIPALIASITLIIAAGGGIARKAISVADTKAVAQSSNSKPAISQSSSSRPLPEDVQPSDGPKIIESSAHN